MLVINNSVVADNAWVSTSDEPMPRGVPADNDYNYEGHILWSL